MYVQRRRFGLGDILSEPELALTPENLTRGYNRDPYNQAVATYTRLQEQYEAIRQAIQLQTDPTLPLGGSGRNDGLIPTGAPPDSRGVIPMRLDPRLAALQSQMDAVMVVIRAYEARMQAIEAARAGQSPSESEAGLLRARFEAWFEQFFQRYFGPMGSPTNEDTLRREIGAQYGGHTEWADEVIAWVRSQPGLSWKLAPGSQPFPIPGATTVTYSDGTVVRPVQGQLAPSPSAPPTPGAWTDIATPSPSVPDPAITASVPSVGTFITQNRVIQDGVDVGAAPRSPSAPYAGGSDAVEEAPPQAAGFGGAGLWIAVAAVAGMVLVGKKKRSR